SGGCATSSARPRPLPLPRRRPSRTRSGRSSTSTSARTTPSSTASTASARATPAAASSSTTATTSPSTPSSSPARRRRRPAPPPAAAARAKLHPAGRALLRPRRPRTAPPPTVAAQLLPGSCRRRQVPPLAAAGFLWALFPSCLPPALPGGGAVWRSSRMARTARRRGRALGGATRERRGRRGDGAGVVGGDPDAAA
ncbi:Os06g0224775, partial [Oryza sativa Japonica Group]